MVNVTEAPHPGEPNVVIESSDIVTPVKKDTYSTIKIVVHNIGDTGIMGAAVGNKSENPGNIVIRVNSGEEQIVEPGYMLIQYYTDPKPNCTRLEFDGTNKLEIKYPTEGTYTIYLIGAHQKSDLTWVADDVDDHSVEVTAKPPVEETATLEGTVMSWFGPIAGAIVELDGMTDETDSSGSYTISSIPLGSYTLKVSHPYYTGASGDVDLTEAKTYYKDFVLSPSLLIIGGIVTAVVGGTVGVVAVIKRLRRKKT